jgi:hypothetical protein
MGISGSVRDLPHRDKFGACAGAKPTNEPCHPGFTIHENQFITT